MSARTLALDLEADAATFDTGAGVEVRYQAGRVRGDGLAAVVVSDDRLSDAVRLRREWEGLVGRWLSPGETAWSPYELEVRRDDGLWRFKVEAGRPQPLRIECLHDHAAKTWALSARPAFDVAWSDFRLAVGALDGWLSSTGVRV